MSASKKTSVRQAAVSPGLGFAIRVVSGTDLDASRLARELGESMRGLIELDVEAGVTAPSGDEPRLLFVDAATPGLRALLERLPRERSAAFVVVREGAPVPAELVEGLAEDVLVHPFRALEVLSKLRHFQRLLESREAQALNAEYSRAVERLRADLQLAERLQKSRLPIRFPDVKGLKITSRYLAGTRSGGCFADLAESRDGQRIAFVLTDASTYRLSSAVLDAIPRALSALSIEDSRSCVTSARRIRDEVLATLGDADSLSLFYGQLSRKDFRLRFLNLGSTRAYYAPPGKAFVRLAEQGGPIVRASGVRAEGDAEIGLEPDGRLALVSAGFVEVVGGAERALELLNRFRDRPSVDAVNELAFRAKSALTEPDELPARDCTAVLFDVDARLLRLA